MNTSQDRHSSGGKKRGRRGRKVTEKELMDEYKFETSHNSVQEQKTMYENIQHLSQREQDLFEQKFAVPKTKAQEIYSSMLRNKKKKKSSQPDPREQVKRCLLLKQASAIFY